MISAARDIRSVRVRLFELLEPRREILEAYVFGSVARNEVQPHSDVDIAVFIDESAADQDGFGYHAALTAELMAGLRCNAVDVVILNQAPPLLYHRVLRDGVRVLSRDLAETTTREARAMSRYFDFIPQLDKIDAVRRSTAPTGVAKS